MRASKFCFAPIGVGFGMRQFNALAAGCVPLIIDVPPQDDKEEKLKGVKSLIKYAALSDFMLVPLEEEKLEGDAVLYPNVIPGYGPRGWCRVEWSPPRLEPWSFRQPSMDQRPRPCGDRTSTTAASCCANGSPSCCGRTEFVHVHSRSGP